MLLNCMLFPVIIYFICFQVHYDKYNRRFGSGGHNTHENIEWSSMEDKIAAFTEEFIHTDMVQTEVEEKSYPFG